MTTKKERHYQTVECEFEGETYSGRFYDENGCVTVTTLNWGTKGDAYTTLGAERMAKHLLREMLENAKRKRLQNIVLVENLLANERRELDTSERGGSQEHIKFGRILVASREAELARLCNGKP